MKIIILMGSPRLNGNTAELCKPFIKELECNNAEVRYINLRDKNVQHCTGCTACQNVEGEYGCVLKDDMIDIVENIIWADCIVLATPIYSWYCSSQMKVVLDRHFGLNKLYGKARGSIWAGKDLAILATHGYEQKYAAEPFETGIKRLCTHSSLNYRGLYSVRDTQKLASFQTAKAVEGAKAFALSLLLKA